MFLKACDISFTSFASEGVNEVLHCLIVHRDTFISVVVRTLRRRWPIFLVASRDTVLWDIHNLKMISKAIWKSMVSRLHLVAYQLSTGRSTLSILRIPTYRYLNIFVLLIHYKIFIYNNINILNFFFLFCFLKRRGEQNANNRAKQAYTSKQGLQPLVDYAKIMVSVLFFKLNKLNLFVYFKLN